MTYEEAIIERAERNGFTYEEEEQGLRVMASSGLSCWHRLGGAAEAAFDQRQEQGLSDEGRWVATHKTVEPEWLPNERSYGDTY